MTQPSRPTRNCGLRVFSASLLSALLIMMPFVQLTRANARGLGAGSRESGRGSSPTVREGVETSAAAENVFVDPSLPGPVAVPLAPTITATMTDTLINDDADNKADPFNGNLGTTEKIEYNVTITNTGSDASSVVFTDTIDTHTTLVPGSVNTQPIADPDTYSASGNIPISLAAPGVLTNDRDPDTGDNTGLTVTKVQGAAPNVGVATDTTATGRGAVKGSVTLNSDGSFTYEPPPGFTGADTFTYEISDGTKTDTATVTINLTQMVWFISNSSGGLNRGTFSNPFTTIASFNTANAGTGATPDPKNGDFIALRTGSGTYSEADGINLRAQQKLIGNAIQFNTVFTADANSSSAYTTFAGAVGTAPNILTSAGNGIDLSTDNTVRGLNVGNVVGFKINGAAVGSPVINTINLTGTGGALNVSTSGAFGANVTFTTLESTSSPGANLNLVGVTGTLGITSPGAGLSGSAAASAAINVDGGSVSFTYSGNVTKGTTGALLNVVGMHTGTLTFNTGLLNATSGTGLQFNNADGSYNFNGTTTLSGGDAGVDILNGSGGTFNFGASTTITSPTGTAFNVGTGAPNVTYNGTITHNTVGQRAVDIDGTTGGSIAINSVTAGSVAGGVGNTGIRINNANGSVAFTTLNLGTSGTRMTQTAVTIAGGSGAKSLGAVSIFTTGAAQGIVSTTTTGSITTGSGTIDTSGGAAVNIVGTSAASRTPLNIQLATVNTSGGSNGIVLTNTSSTGSPGGFNILGTSAGNCGGIANPGGVSGTAPDTADCTGGRIQNTVGATGGNPGIGILLTDVDKVSLTRVRVDNHDNFGVKGTNVAGFILTSAYFHNNGDDVGGDGEGGIYFYGLTGTAGQNSVTNSYLDLGAARNFQVVNTSGTLDRLTISGTTIGNDGFSGSDGIFLQADNSANTAIPVTLKATVQNGRFHGSRGDGLQMSCRGTSVTDLVFTGHRMTNNHTNQVSGSMAVTISAGGSAGSFNPTNTYNISNNIINNNSANNSSGPAVTVGKGGVSADASFVGTISGNTIGTAGVANSGSAQGSCIVVDIVGGGVHNSTITNNTCRQFTNYGILALSGGKTAGGGTGNLILDIRGNNIAEPSPLSASTLFPTSGIRLVAGTNSGDDHNNCWKIGGTAVADKNTLTGTGTNGGNELRVFQRFLTILAVSGQDSVYGGANNDNTAMNNFLLARNVTTDVNATNNTATPGPGYSGTCTAPLALAIPENGAKQDYVAQNVDTAQPSAETQSKAVLVTNEISNQNHLTAKVSEVTEAITHSVADIAKIAAAQPSTSAPANGREARTLAHHAQTGKARVRSEVSDQRSEVKGHHAKVTRAFTPVISGETVTVNIGTLRAGDSVTITFQVTVDNPPNLSLLNPARVSNQGSVAYNDGVTPQTPVLTDDPAVGGANDPTETEVDLFDTTTTVITSGSPSNQNDPVTFTATVAENPAQAGADPTGTVQFLDGATPLSCTEGGVNGIRPLSGGTAACTTAAITPAGSPHTINANYSGDGNFDPSSGSVQQTVIACATNPIVTTNADSGAGSLRQAILDACNGTTIDFAIDPGTGPHTITLTTGELALTKNVTIRNTSGESVTVSGNVAGRVFNINSGKTAAIIGLTISGGSTGGNGGGVLNDGTLTIINSLLTGNTAGTDGGAVSSSTTSLTLINTTLSGNNANGFGGGVDVLGGTATIINSTITGNHGDNDDGSGGGAGGIRQQGGTVTLHNTIVAGNFKGSGTTTANDIEGTVEAASSNNLIGDATTSGGLTHGVDGNIVGAAVASVLNTTLANNGGLTFTHALVASGPAVEAGNNANLPVDTFDLDGNANMAEALPVDQRGVGFPRNADSSDPDTIQTVDIGAFELHPTIEDITDKLTAEDTAVPQITFNLGDGTGSLIASVTATSGNPTLVPNANILVGGSGSTRTLDITPAADANSPADGTATITVTVTATNGQTAVDTFVVTVTDVNDAPVPTNDIVPDVAEDSGTYVIPFATLLANDTNKGAPNESGQTLNITAVSAPTGGTVAINGTDVEFTPTADFFGPAGFTYTVTDNGTTNGVNDFKTGNATVSFNVTAVNDDPVLAANNGITVNEGSLGNIITSAMLSVTDVDNTPAQLTYTIGTAPANGTLKKSGGALAGGGTFTQADINANLITYDHDGSDTTSDSFTFTVSDGAGGSIGLTTFNITITAANDAPSVTAGGTLNYTEGDAATAIDTTITVTDTDSANLVSATAQITGNYVNGEDVLSFTDTATISGIFNAGSGTLTLTGSDTVANYQAALRAVKYNNTSENPSTSARTVSWIVNDGSLPSSAVTSTINVTSVNDPPVNTVPGPQGTNPNTPLTFSSGNGNQISVADVDAGAADIRITLTATNGTITLSTTSGLNFACGGCAGDGTADTTMTFEGTLTEVNTAMNGMTFTPTAAFTGAATLTITSNDLGNTGTGGAQSDTDVVNIQVSTNINVQDAKVAEPSSGTTNMVFTVTLSAPAPAGGTSVNFQTSDGTAKDGVGEANQDYTATSGTVNFAVGEQLKTINVPVLSDSDNSEVDETFTVTLSSPVNGTIADGTATGTITVANPAGTLLISELRTSGPGGAGDDFVEIYNNTGSNITVPAGGYGLFKMGADCNATPVLIGTIPAGTNIPARGHFLFVGSAYSLANYGGTNAAAGDVGGTLTADIENDRNVALFSTTDVAAISSVNRFDAVGFGVNTGGVCDLLREGTNLTPTSGSVLEYSYFRKQCDWIQGLGCTVPGVPKDTNQNSDDFWLADTAGSAITGRLGAPGPENLGSPIRRDNAGINMVVLDGTVGSSASPNRERNGTAVPNGTFGTMTLRYRVTNNTGASVTRLRYRVVDISTAIQPPGPTADLRALTSSIEPSVGPVGDSVTCTAGGAGAPPCTVTVQATTLETPPAQAIGGGYNSTLSSGTITTITPLGNGNSILINFKLGVEKTGTFRFYIIIEALP